MSDYIDRDEVIGDIHYFFDGLAPSWVEASERIIDIIREVPEKPQKEYTEQNVRDAFNSGYSCGMEGDWIPIDEEYPADSEEVLVTLIWDEYGDRIIAYGHYNADIDKWKLYSDAEGHLIKGYTVKAWMPTPNPYFEQLASI